ncbi:CDGSH iron-sulfur domain-containing protein NEET [Bienertia sinuspersici]
MASSISNINGFCYTNYPSFSSVEPNTKGFVTYPSTSQHKKRSFLVRAETVNPEIRKSEEKVVDSVVVTELSKNITPYCRCWRSGTFPMCDGSHVKHNKATGDNVGPLLLKKQ